ALFRSSRKVSTYTDEFGVAKLFSKVDELGTPWHGVESWESLEGEFVINITCDSSGHVTIQIKLTQWNGGNEDWHITVHLNTELGQLTKIASEARAFFRSEEHTSELQSRENLVCRLLLEKKKKNGEKKKTQQTTKKKKNQQY